jgi:hypothetical protein
LSAYPGDDLFGPVGRLAVGDDNLEAVFGIILGEQFIDGARYEALFVADRNYDCDKWGQEIIL